MGFFDSIAKARYEIRPSSHCTDTRLIGRHYLTFLYYVKAFDSDEELEDPSDFKARGWRWGECCGAVAKMKASGSSYEDYLNLTESDVFISQDLEQIKLVRHPEPAEILD